MKVYELLNKLKGTNATLEEIKSWSYMNKISPCMLEGGLELDCEYPPALKDTQEKVCSEVNGDCLKCLEVFFNKELENEKPEEKWLCPYLEDYVTAKECEECNQELECGCCNYILEGVAPFTCEMCNYIKADIEDIGAICLPPDTLPEEVERVKKMSLKIRTNIFVVNIH